MSKMLIEKFKDWNIPPPSLHVVMGSGLSTGFAELQLNDWADVGQIYFRDFPGIPASTVVGHPGMFRYYQHKKSGLSICFQAGRLHGYEGLKPREAIAPVMAARLAGTKRFLLTNAAGSLRPEFHPGSVMMISDHVNMTGQNPLVGANPVDEAGTPLGPRFPDMSTIYDLEMRKNLRVSLKKRQIDVFEGVYLGVLGPTFETPAEVKLYSSWGMGSVGMSTVWEALALKHSGATLAGLSVISNYGCGLVNSEILSHEEVETLGRGLSKTLLEALFEFGVHYAGL